MGNNRSFGCSVLVCCGKLGGRAIEYPHLSCLGESGVLRCGRLDSVGGRSYITDQNFLGSLPGIQVSISAFINEKLLWTMAIAFVVSFLPLPEDLWLGNSGSPLFAPIAPCLALIALGLLCVTWWLLRLLMLPLRLTFRFRSRFGTLSLLYDKRLTMITTSQTEVGPATNQRRLRQ